ncbi:MAG TPA: hypothetical protein VFC41_04545 [Anaerovoracaceae bacterium]|nr:hypothetical protein [Anaerovoracaceae bacterium]
MKTIKKIHIVGLSAMLTLFISLTNAQPRPGIECGCEKYDNYILPASKESFLNRAQL